VHVVGDATGEDVGVRDGFAVGLLVGALLLLEVVGALLLLGVVGASLLLGEHVPNACDTEGVSNVPPDATTSPSQVMVYSPGPNRQQIPSLQTS